MARKFGSFSKEREIKEKGQLYLESYWKSVKVDLEILIKKMDADHHSKWESVKDAMHGLTNLQQIRDHYEEQMEQIRVEKEQALKDKN
jgi:hypothetical protein